MGLSFSKPKPPANTNTMTADAYTEPRPVGSFPKSGIQVVVVGAGFAGLVAALECFRKGHQVQVLERNGDVNMAGDTYFMGLSATRWFKHWPELTKEFEKISLHNAWIETLQHDGNKIIPARYVRDRYREAGLDPKTPPGTFQMRPLVYKMLLNQTQKLGIDIQFGKRAVDFYEDATKGRAGVTCDDGSSYEGDVVIAADGVGSPSQKITGGQVKAQSSGRAMWRAAYDKSHLDKDPEVREYFKMVPTENGPEPIIRTFLAPNGYCLTVSRPNHMVWIMNHDVTGTDSESWTKTIDTEEVLREMDKTISGRPWAPILKQLVRTTPQDTVINFELFWRNPKPNWDSPGSRVIQIGDSAHSFLPASGNGATQAIEDAVCLASCLHLCGGKENIPDAVKAHIRFRYIRTACAQKIGFSNAELLQNTDWAKAKKDHTQAQPKLPKWVWGHDCEQYAYRYWSKNLEGVRKGIPLDQDESMPPNFPPGYKYEPWSIEEIMECKKNGEPMKLGSGDWS